MVISVKGKRKGSNFRSKPETVPFPGNGSVTVGELVRNEEGDVGASLVDDELRHCDPLLQLRLQQVQLVAVGAIAPANYYNPVAVIGHLGEADRPWELCSQYYKTFYGRNYVAMGVTQSH